MYGFGASDAFTLSSSHPTPPISRTFHLPKLAPHSPVTPALCPLLPGGPHSLCLCKGPCSSRSALRCSSGGDGCSLWFADICSQARFVTGPERSRSVIPGISVLRHTGVFQGVCLTGRELPGVVCESELNPVFQNLSLQNCSQD